MATVALAVCAALAVVSLMLGAIGDDLAVLVGALVGFVPASVLLLVSRSVSFEQLVVWIIGTVLLVGVSSLSSFGAIETARAMSDGDGCVLPFFQFEVDEVSTVDVDWWPPRVLCRYGYGDIIDAPDSFEWHQRWSIYLPFALVPLVIVHIVGIARQVRRGWHPRRLSAPSQGDRRRAPSRSSSW